MVIEVKQNGKFVKIPYITADVPVSEAPEDGKQYARKDGDWSEIVIPGGEDWENFYSQIQIQEQNRQTNEEARVLADSERDKTFTSRMQEITTATQNADTAARVAEESAQEADKQALAAKGAAADAQDTADHPTYIGSDYHVYKWNKEAKAYNKTDIFVKGDAFSIKKVYPSISDMNADLNNPEIKEGHFVLINTNNVEDSDNAQLYIKTYNEETGVFSYEFVVDMSGAIGFTGKTPQFSIGNVSKGDEPAVSLSPDGTDADGNPKYKLNIVLPKGDTGNVGPIGPVGPEGKQGPIGPKGDTGAAFTYDMFTPDQLALLVGPVGPAGAKGDKGDTGAQGPQGLRGENGVSCDWQWSGTSLRIYGASGWSSYVNLQGPQGPKGDTGAKGATGATGPAGKNLEFSWNGYTLGVRQQGQTTYTYSQSLRGATGATGPQGPKGDKGDTGATGPQGPKGDSGVFSGGNVTSAIVITSGVMAEAIQFKRTSGGAAIVQGQNSFELTTYSSSSNIKFNVGGDNKISLGSNQNYTKIAWTVGSDIRSKNVLGPVTDVTKVLGLGIIRYTRKDDSTSKECIGVSAQDLLKIFPEFVAYDSTEDFYSVDYAGLGACVAVLGYKSLHKEIEKLKQVITEHGWEFPAA